MILKTIRYSLIGLLLGIAAAVVIMQQDPWVKECCGNVVQQAFARAGNCKLSGTVKTLNLLHGYIDFADVVAQPHQGNAWQWKAKQMRVGFSWGYLLLYGSLELHIEFADIVGNSQYADGNVALLEHITAFMRASPVEIPTSLQALRFERALFTLMDTASKSSYCLMWDSQSRRMGNIFKSQIHLLNGNIAISTKTFVDKLKGNLQLDFYTGNKNLQVAADVALTGNCLCLGNQVIPCSIKGSWKKDSGVLTIHNAEKTLALSSKISMQNAHETSIALQGSIPLEYVLATVSGIDTSSNLQGCCQVSADITVSSDDKKIIGTCDIEDIKYAGIPVGLTCSASCGNGANNTWHGQVSFLQGNNKCSGTWAYDKGSWFVEVDNATALQLAAHQQWLVPQNKCRIKLINNGQGAVTGNYSFSVVHDQNHESIDCAGAISYQDNELILQGTLEDMHYKLLCCLQPQIHLQELVLKNHQTIPLIELHTLARDHNRVEGAIAFELIKKILHKIYNLELQGEGVFDVRMLLGDTLTTKIQLQNGTIRLPYTYNFIQNFNAVMDVNTQERSITLSGVTCSLHKGEVACDKATVIFDPAYNISFLHMPMIMTRCLLNVNKDLFANISGRLLMVKQGQKIPSLKGQLLIEQAQLKENILSHLFQKDVGSFASSMLIGLNDDMACDVHIATKDLIQVKTPFLETKAKVGLHIKNTLKFPEIDGSIDLLSGSLYFPYKPLFITQGRILFMANQLKDPLITLSAKNKIKKFNVGLHVTGSLTNHHIALQASPFLTEEQIVALLLTGSQEESMNIIMPALIMNNITDLIFGRDHGSLNLDRYFKKFLRPLSRVHVIPSLSDQTARGGLRAAVELDINERWRAMLQKNFSLSEDTRLEIECQLSDDISIRGIRDERRDIGGEVEMRWKF